MRRQKKPPKRFRLSWNESHTDGELRKWACNKKTKEFRDDLTLWLRKKQKDYCSYCSLSLGLANRRAFALDHFVPKAERNGEPEWTFEIYNLILSCEYCNSKRKKQHNPLVASGLPYKRSQFSIVHPYLDRVSDHIKGGYRGGADVPSTPRPMTVKGQLTVNMFALDSPDIRYLWEAEHQKVLDRKTLSSWTPTRQSEFYKAIDELRK
ncbi:hypothetical protein CIK61_18000 [Brevibacterium aurantiacum]|uniref:HNH endonuclease n=1 Tax=Brevibacterium aurantiacum TaxID=273384 RepID=UPI000DF33DB4|nr:HNH endonuclease [Brevibacterium aurantiacum]RCS91225.1 hypothetical protein CIK61_18000 [Brevibacterium aurantiacum]